MNLFFLSLLVDECARSYVDKHLKILIEAAQMLSAAHHEAGDAAQAAAWAADKRIYRRTHANHPMAVWVRAHRANYRWTVALALALADEYFHRYGHKKARRHKTEAVVRFLAEHEPAGMPSDAAALDARTGLTPVPQCMPDEFKVDGDPVAAYRAYYQSPEKVRFASWTARERPAWYGAKLRCDAKKRKRADE